MMELRVRMNKNAAKETGDGGRELLFAMIGIDIPSWFIRFTFQESNAYLNSEIAGLPLDDLQVDLS